MTAKDNIVNKIKKENEEMHKKAGKAELPAEELAVKDEFSLMTLERDKKRFLKAMIIDGKPPRRNKSVWLKWTGRWNECLKENLSLKCFSELSVISLRLSDLIQLLPHGKLICLVPLMAGLALR